MFFFARHGSPSKCINSERIVKKFNPKGGWDVVLCIGDEGGYLPNTRVVWMPAHRPQSSIGHAMKSNGHPINALDWRANRLVDALAKMAAMLDSAPDIAFSLHKKVTLRVWPARCYVTKKQKTHQKRRFLLLFDFFENVYSVFGPFVGNFAVNFRQNPLGTC